MRQEKKKAERKRAELLAPAGSEQAFVAAIENGADAVYVGGRSFNARMNAGNFDDEALRSAIAWAHLRGADVHVTMNTLLRDEEILPAVRYAGFLYEAGADALIVQDFGLAGVLTRELPDLPLHLSTQATAYDAACVRAAEQLGFRRAVLSRELSYQQIREITAGTDMEIETFVHGALCVCYSGQCQLSRYIGGRSGNRGACAQPCRLPWETAGAGAPKYALSPRDLCLLGDLPALIECGVRSFKIEGRMKSPEYVAVVTRIYRKYIDLYYSGAPYAVDPADREELTQIFSRGGFTRGFFGGEPGKGFLAGDVPKHEGLRVGTVVARPKQKESGAGGRGRGRREEAGPTLVDVRADRPIETGDGVEIHPADGRAAAGGLPGNIVTYRKERAGGVLRIGDIRGTVRPGDLVYRTSSRAQLLAARETFAGKSIFEQKSDRRIPVRFRVFASAGGRVRILAEAGGRKAEVQGGPYPADPAGAAEGRLRAALQKTGGTAFRAASVDFTGAQELEIRVSECNRLRREVLDRLTAEIAAGRSLPEGWDAAMAAEEARWAPRTEQDLGGAQGVTGTPARQEALCFWTWGDYAVWAGRRAKKDAAGRTLLLLPALECLAHREELAEVPFIPYLSNVTRGKESEAVEEHFAALVELAQEPLRVPDPDDQDGAAAAGRVRGIVIGTAGWAIRFREAGALVRAGSGLNVYNRFAEETLRTLGIAPGLRSLETVEPGDGAFPLMTTEYEPAGTMLRSLAGKPISLRIVRRPWSSQTVLLPAEEPAAQRVRIAAAEENGQDAGRQAAE